MPATITPGTGGTTGSALDARVTSEFESALEIREREADPVLESVWLDIQSTRDQELHHVWESVPVPVIHRRGDPISKDSFGERFATIINYAWARGLEWFLDDESDDQTGMLVSRASDLSRRFIELKVRILAQLLAAATDDDLLPAQPNAYDGSALFLGTTRFGNASGNVVTGGGVATVAAIQTDYWAGIVRLLSFQDTEGRPYWTPQDLIGEHILVVYPHGLSRRMEEAFEQDVIGQVLGTDAGTSVSNVLRLSRRKPHLYPTPELSGNDWFLLVVGHEARPLAWQTREALNDWSWDPSNSDYGRDYVKAGHNWRARIGAGVFEARGATQINNT